MARGAARPGREGGAAGRRRPVVHGRRRSAGHPLGQGDRRAQRRTGTAAARRCGPPGGDLHLHAVRGGARCHLGRRPDGGGRSGDRRRGGPEDVPGPARPHRQPPPLAARGPQLRVVLGGPAAGRAARRRLRARSAVRRRGLHGEALRRQRVRARAHGRRQRDRRADAARAPPAPVRAGGAGGRGSRDHDRLQPAQRGALRGQPPPAHLGAARRLGLRGVRAHRLVRLRRHRRRPRGRPRPRDARARARLRPRPGHRRAGRPGRGEARRRGALPSPRGPRPDRRARRRTTGPTLGAAAAHEPPPRPRGRGRARRSCSATRASSRCDRATCGGSRSSGPTPTGRRSWAEARRASGADPWRRRWRRCATVSAPPWRWSTNRHWTSPARPPSSPGRSYGPTADRGCVVEYFGVDDLGGRLRPRGPRRRRVGGVVRRTAARGGRDLLVAGAGRAHGSEGRPLDPLARPDRAGAPPRRRRGRHRRVRGRSGPRPGVLRDGDGGADPRDRALGRPARLRRAPVGGHRCHRPRRGAAGTAPGAPGGRRGPRRGGGAGRRRGRGRRRDRRRVGGRGRRPRVDGPPAAPGRARRGRCSRWPPTPSSC